MNRDIRKGLLALILAAAIPVAISATRAVELGVSSSGRHLTLKHKPFFWLGDTVWLLAQVPSRDELAVYR